MFPPTVAALPQLQLPILLPLCHQVSYQEQYYVGFGASCKERLFQEDNNILEQPLPSLQLPTQRPPPRIQPPQQLGPITPTQQHPTLVQPLPSLERRHHTRVQLPLLLEQRHRTPGAPLRHTLARQRHLLVPLRLIPELLLPRRRPPLTQGLQPNTLVLHLLEELRQREGLL